MVSGISVHPATTQSSIGLPADIAELRASLRDAAVRERLREDWRERLGACLKSVGPGA